jgi:zinc protease
MSSFASWTTGVCRRVLSNGLTILVQREPSAPAAAVITHVRAGFFDEPDHWAGISHVLEHMFFKGTPSRGVGEVARQTKAAGGYLNAGTSYDYTMYYTVLPADHLEEALDIQADALQHATLDAGELARELRVIIQEARRKRDAPGSMAQETLHEVLFDRHRIRRWRIGHEADLARFTREDVAGYYHSRYVPGRTIVAIVGDVDPERALALAEARYHDWPAAAGAVDPSPEEPARRDIRARTLRGPITQSHLVIGWRGVPPLHPDAPALDLAAAVLGQGRGGWLYTGLRTPGLATSVAAWNYAPTELGVFSIAVELEAGRVPVALGQIAGAVHRLRTAGPTEDDVERARALLLTRWARRLESTDGRAVALAASEALGGVALLDEEFARLARVSAEEIRAAASRYLDPKSMAAVTYLPEGAGEDLTVAALTGAFASPPPPPPARPVPRLETARANGRVSGRVRAEVLHVALDGVDLLLRQKRGVPTVTVGVYALRAHGEDPAEAGIGALALRSSLRGAGDFGAEDLAIAAERLGGSLGWSAGGDWLGFGATVMAREHGRAARLLRMCLEAPRFAAEDVVREREMMVEEARQVADDTFQYPFQLAFRGAFGDRGYGLPATGLPETLPDITPARVAAWHASQLRGSRLTVLAVGDLEPQPAADALAAVFGDWRGTASSPAAREVWRADSLTERAVTLGKAQSAFAMLFPGPARRDRLRHAAEVWAAVASGLGGRLFDALRERRSLAYTVLATTWQRGRAGALGTYIATAPEREEEARAAMLEELARFAREPVTALELRQATGYLAGQAVVRRQSSGSVASELLDAWLVGEGLGELEDPAAPYRQVTVEEVWEVARESLRPERRAEGIVRGVRNTPTGSKLAS